MTRIWSPENRFRIWFEIEAHACDALAMLGIIRWTADCKLGSGCRVSDIGVVRVSVRGE